MIITLGVSHKTAPIAVREKVALTSVELPRMLQSIKRSKAAQECVVISTCNRTEIYGFSQHPEKIIDCWQTHSGMSSRMFQEHLYHLSNEACVRHLMRVASGLDSLVVGEPQILSQLKKAYHTAHTHGGLGRCLGRLFQKSFMVAKLVRTETAIGKYPVSVAFSAVKLAKQIFTDLQKARVLLIGAGETIELVSRHLKTQGVTNETYANRSFERAQALAASMGGHALPLAQIQSHLADFDIIISAVGSPEPILTAPMVTSALKKAKRHPIFMVDLSVPRSIDEAVREHEDIYLYDMDDLQQVIETNLSNRQAEATLAESIILEQSKAFMSWVSAQKAYDLVKSYRQRADDLKLDLINKAYNELALGHDPKKVVEYLAHRLTQKLLHHPSIRLKQAGEANEDKILHAANELMNVE